jgi:hypothetical protein
MFIPQTILSRKGRKGFNRRGRREWDTTLMDCVNRPAILQMDDAKKTILLMDIKSLITCFESL